jgi:hypothetical protein
MYVTVTIINKVTIGLHAILNINNLIYKNPVRTAKKTPHFSITKTSWIKLLGK